MGNSAKDKCRFDYHFIKKWFYWFVSELNLPSNHDHHLSSLDIPVIPWKNKLSLKIAWLFNLLNYPLFYTGIIFVIWLLIEPLLKLSMSPAVLKIITVYDQKIQSILAPAVVGYWTNWLAIRMLFHPRHSNWVWQGLIPARRRTIIDHIVAGVSTNLFSPIIVIHYLHENAFMNRLASLTEKLTIQTEFRDDLKAFIKEWLIYLLNNQRLQDGIKNTIKELIQRWKADSWLEVPLELSKSVWGSLLENKIMAILSDIPESLDAFYQDIDEWLDNLPDYIENEHDKVEKFLCSILEETLQILNIQEIIRKQLEKMDDAELENLLTHSVNTEIMFIQTSGGIFGLLIGLALIFPVMRIVLLVTGAGLWFLYKISVIKKAD